jgi:hypothetical protein
MQYGMFYMHRCEQSGGQEIGTLLRMNPRGSKYVRENRNKKLNIN